MNRQTTQVKVSDYVITFLAGLGLRRVYTLPGGGCMHLVDSLGRSRDLVPVGFLHEQAAAIAADAEAQYAGRPAAVLVTTGPGATNALTAVTASWIDSTPLIVLSGQVKTKDLAGPGGPRQKGIQEAPVLRMAGPVTKYAVTVTDPEEIRFHLEKAAWLAAEGRPGPVWLDLPLDVQGALVDARRLRGFAPPRRKSDTARLRARARKTAALLQKAGRPVILAGHGLRQAGALADFKRLVRRLGVPVLTTWRAADFLGEKHPLYFGRPGSIAARGANFVQQNADLLLVLGARLDLPQVGHNYPGFAPEARKIVVDADPRELAKLALPGALKFNCDAGAFVLELLRQAPEGRAPAAWLRRCRAWKRRYPVGRGVLEKPTGRVNTYDLVAELSKAMSPRDLLVPGSSGSCAEITLQAFKIKPGQRVLNTPGLGSMGFGLPAAAGACLASGRRTVTVLGDGGLQHNIQALETIKRLKLPVKIFVLDNGGYGSIRAMQARHFKGNYVCCDAASGQSLPDAGRVARAYGIRAITISGPRQLAAGVRGALRSNGPLLCLVKVEPRLETAPRLASAVNPDGTIVSRPLEDLWPFLGPEELAANMGKKAAGE
jgi:acetolactate synthase I/II/III large subunit